MAITQAGPELKTNGGDGNEHVHNDSWRLSEIRSTLNRIENLIQRAEARPEIASAGVSASFKLLMQVEEAVASNLGLDMQPIFDSNAGARQPFQETFETRLASRALQYLHADFDSEQANVVALVTGLLAEAGVLTGEALQVVKETRMGLPDRLTWFEKMEFIRRHERTFQAAVDWLLIYLTWDPRTREFYIDIPGVRSALKEFVEKNGRNGSNNPDDYGTGDDDETEH